MLQLILAVRSAVRSVVANARAGLMQVDQNAGAFLGYAFERAANQIVALAIGGTEYIAIDAVRMHAHQHVGFSRDLAMHQREVALGQNCAGIDNRFEAAEFGAEAAFGLTADEALGLQA